MSNFHDPSNNVFFSLFMPLTSGTPITTHFKINGVDIGSQYQAYRNGTRVNNTGYQVADGSDLSMLFQSKLVSLVYIPTGKEYIKPTITSDSITWHIQFENVKEYQYYDHFAGLKRDPVLLRQVAGDTKQVDFSMSPGVSSASYAPFIALMSFDGHSGGVANLTSQHT